MKSQRVIEHRDQSVPATCERILGELADDRLWLCGAPLQLLVTPSVLSYLPYEELVVIRCGVGHITRGDGVLLDA